MTPDDRTPFQSVERASEVALLVVEEAQLPAVVIDPASKEILAVNEEFVDVFAWQPRQVENERVTDLVAEEDRWSLRDMLSIIAYGGSCDPVTTELVGPEGDTVTTTWVGIPNILEDPMECVTVVCRPKGQTLGKPIGPPASLQPREKIKRIPPRERVRDDRRMARTSRSLWDRE